MSTVDRACKMAEPICGGLVSLAELAKLLRVPLVDLQLVLGTKHGDMLRDDLLARLAASVEHVTAVAVKLGEINEHKRLSWNARRSAKNHLLPVLRRDGPYCRYCGKRVTDRTRTLDHVVPVCQGGSHRPDNLVIACRHCNFRKSGELYDVMGMELLPPQGDPDAAPPVAV